MRIFLTGASGFLGKHVLKRLIANERVSKIVVSTRRRRRHESPKVEVSVLDLTQAADLPVDLSEIDAIVHLAGLYDFNASFQECYEHNVLATLNLVRAAKNEGRPIPIHFASTYAVGCHSDRALREEPLAQLPQRTESYAHTKALAENCLAESGLPVRIFRLGILMGDSRRGEIEKIDGPYAFMQLIRGLARNRFSERIPLIPVPASPDTILPLVPVDIAAEVLVESCLEGSLEPGQPEFYGVYRPSSAKVSEVVEAAIQEYLPQSRVWYLRKRLPDRVLQAQQLLTGIPGNVFSYANHSTRLDASRFESKFGRNRIPGFAAQKDLWLRGFRDYMEGGVG